MKPTLNYFKLIDFIVQVKCHRNSKKRYHSFYLGQIQEWHLKIFYDHHQTFELFFDKN